MPPCAAAASSSAACTLAGSVTSASRASAPALRTPSRVAGDRATPAMAQPSATSVSIAARPRLRAPKMIALRSLPRLSPIEGSVSTHTSNPAPPPPLFRGSDRQPGPAHVYTSPMSGRRSSFEIDEQCNSDHDENEGDDQPRDERDFDEGGGALLTVCGDLLQTCRLLPRVTNHAYNLRFDRLAELQLVRWSVAVLSDATFLLVIVHDATSGGSVPESLIPGVDMSLLASTTRDADRGFRASDLSSPDPGDWRRCSCRPHSGRSDISAGPIPHPKSQWSPTASSCCSCSAFSTGCSTLPSSLRPSMRWARRSRSGEWLSPTRSANSSR